MALGTSLLHMMSVALIVAGAVGLLVSLLFGTLWADRGATRGTVVRERDVV